MHLIKPNWDVFKSKFSDNPQINFEWFCYLLFCKEYNKKNGIFRYKNQAGAETEPIEIDNEVIVWQAKFFDTTLSKKSKEINDTIKKCKSYYPNITKIIFYTNQEWAKGNKQVQPKTKIAAEETCKKNGIDLVWRTASFFESEFVTVDSSLISSHFFSNNISLFDFLESRERYLETLLYNINTDIIFNSQTIQIDRSDLLKEMEEKITENQVLVLHGIGGVGKTSLVKDFYNKFKDNYALYIFKASEFNINNINELFDNCKLEHFLEFYKDIDNKVIVIDSAEKLLDVENEDPFKYFISTLIKNNWKIIFTTRNNYVDNLYFQFIRIFNINPLYLEVKKLNREDLNDISCKNNFVLPEESKLLELISIPFYLNEYLKIYKNNEPIEYINFKKILWDNIIRKSKSARETCFLEIALTRANTGQFFVKSNFDSNVLEELQKDGIIGYEVHGYFISHDIYEEWALENIIYSKYNTRDSNKSFFCDIGESLPIRRSFRHWISEKLFLKDESIYNLIEDTITNEEVESFWKDEILISVMISDYCENFFNNYKEKLFENNNRLLEKIAFLLRLACKEINVDKLNMKIKFEEQNSYIMYLFSIPKGKGWNCIIKFVYENIDRIKIERLGFILEIINDWNNNFKSGETTKLASLIALKHYQFIIEKDIYFSRRDDTEEKILQTILFGSSEIKDELSIIFEQILENKWSSHRDPYYNMVKFILTKFNDNIEVIKALPEYVLKLANLYWFKKEESNNYLFHSSIDIEGYFSLDENRLDYYPASAYQTPVYVLLKVYPKKTIDFILYFTNTTVESFAKSELGIDEVTEIDVFIKENLSSKQYVSSRIWNMYRGTSVVPNVLASIHMALEKFLMEMADSNLDSKILESWLMYLLQNTKSSSITAIITSIVLYAPNKTSNIALTLFKTKEIFQYDTERLVSDLSFPIIGFNKNGVYVNERTEASKESFRKNTLENIALAYQIFLSKDFNEEEFLQRRKEIWNIIDEYYENLPIEEKQVDLDKIWRLCLSRMDSRKLTPQMDDNNGNVQISFETNLDPKLEEYSKKSLENINQNNKYISLKLWSDLKIKNDYGSKKYEQYENNKDLVLKEVKEILKKLKKSSYEFDLMNNGIPEIACSVLIKYYIDILTEQDKEFCKMIILQKAKSSFYDGYQYQINDGVEATISVLPILLKEFSDSKKDIKEILLITMFDYHNIGMYCEFSEYSQKAIKDLWKISFEDAKSLLLGYLIFKPKYEEVKRKVFELNQKKHIYEQKENQFISTFLRKYSKDIQSVIENKVSINDIKNIDDIDLHILSRAFNLIVFEEIDEDVKKITKDIITTISKKMNTIERIENELDYKFKHKFFSNFSYLCLNSNEKDINIYLNFFIKDEFQNFEILKELIEEFIYMEDKLQKVENFWYIWSAMYNKVVKLYNTNKQNWYVSEIIKAFLFASIMWNENAQKWHTFRIQDKNFFKNTTQNIVGNSDVLYSIVKLLDGIGSIYLNDGVIWVSDILKNNRNLFEEKLEEYTIYHTENIIRKYIYINREKIKKTKVLKGQVLVILEFLINKGSVIGYIMREDIL